MSSYSDFFVRATAKALLPYQKRLHEYPSRYTALSVPTGLGKTDAVLVDWLARRPTTRLVWCLPGRTLTRQVASIARERVKALGMNVAVFELMGGSRDNDSTLRPDEPAILVATQDIAVSRALNRGYARSPFRWPVDFALLNNDVQWVFDEVQLLGDALATSAQLAAFRESFSSFGEVPCVWMSATFDRTWLDTVDFKGRPVRMVALDGEDENNEIVRRRLHARKDVQPAPPECRLPKGCAQFVMQQHRPGSLTLVIANTVERAREIWSELQPLRPVLLHSRFRPADRVRPLERLLKERAGVVVSTQVIEAGIDLDADLLVTDAAPWPSLVQRFGRVNRYGDKDEGRIYWVDRPLRAKQKRLASAAEIKEKEEQQVFAPYEPEEVSAAVEQLSPLTSASPGALPGIASLPPYSFVLRRTDLLDLFDTTPDLAGNQIDVSRFVRSGKEHDVYIAWREWEKNSDPPRKPFLSDGELCAVPLGTDLKTFLKKNGAWVWRHTGKGRWEALTLDEVYPGMRLVVRASAGGYEAESGWHPDTTGPVPPVLPEGNQDEEATNDDLRSAGPRQTISAHTDAVVAALRSLAGGLEIAELAPYWETLETAARKHDWGKAHPVFQQTLHGLSVEPQEPPAELLAKQGEGVTANRRHSREWFRHELASAVAMLAEGDSDLAAYIAAAHHGKVRVNIRSMPGEVERAVAGARIARGIHDFDSLFPADLGGGAAMRTAVLSLAISELGRGDGETPGWTDRVLSLLEREGPFRLAFLETLLRAADECASAANSAKGEDRS
ncbi:MAG: CRISPR-associated helicase Cas3' [Acidobacteriota bacterium]